MLQIILCILHFSTSNQHILLFKPKPRQQYTLKTQLIWNNRTRSNSSRSCWHLGGGPNIATDEENFFKRASSTSLLFQWELAYFSMTDTATVIHADAGDAAPFHFWLPHVSKSSSFLYLVQSLLKIQFCKISYQWKREALNIRRKPTTHVWVYWTVISYGLTF